MKHAIITTLIAILVLPLATPITLESTSTDPAFLTTGAEATIATTLYRNVGDEDQGRLRISLQPGSRLTEQYIRIDRDADPTIAHLTQGETYNTKHEIYIEGDAPTGTYRFELRIYDEEKRSTTTKPFTLTVDRDGVSLDATVTETTPRILRPGEDTAQIQIRYTNDGEQPLEDITVNPTHPDGITTVYSEDQSYRIPRLEPGAHTDLSLTLELEETLQPGTYNEVLNAEYEDTDQNTYTESHVVPLRIDGRPHLQLTTTKTQIPIGETQDVQVEIKNNGTHTAENVEARLIIQPGQPITPLDRSQYIGDLKPGEARNTTFNLETQRTAKGTQNILLQLRHTGEADEGDTSVYTERESFNLELVPTENNYSTYTVIGAVALLLAGITYAIKRRKQRNPRR